MRDKLIELLMYYFIGSCDKAVHPKERIDALADYLIAGGVTVGDVPDICVGKWIPVSKRLPTERGRYWAWCKFYVRDKKVERPQVRYFSPELNAFTLDGGRDGEVTHWMPIESPKEGNNE